MNPGDIVLMDIKTSDHTMGEVMRAWDQWEKQFPGHEILMDGDAYAIVARPRKVRA